jgi:hypothetical protein
MKLFQPAINKKIPLLIFIACLVAFAALKIPALHLPFFWDESGVYGKMVFELADQNLSLHPKAINEWISRGHPLLYPNLIALGCKIFGTNVLVSHTMNFLLACGLLIAMFIHLGRIFHPWVGLTASVLLMAQPIFFTQSVFVLPEVALVLSLWLTTWHFIQKKPLFYFLSGSAAVLIKEPAIIWIGSLFLWDALFEKKILHPRSLLWLSPLIAFGIFLGVQKQTYGWYFFPYHTGGFTFSPSEIALKAWQYLEFLFWRHGRISWTLLLLTGIVIVAFKIKSTTLKQKPSLQHRYLSALFASLCYLLFCSTTFFGERYIMVVMPYICSLVAYMIYFFVFPEKPVYLFITLAMMVFWASLFMKSPSFNYDNDMSYERSVRSTRKTIHYMLENQMLNQGEFTATMPVIFGLADPRFGYMPPASHARHSQPIHPGTKYAVQVIPGTPVENPEQFPLDTFRQWNDGDIRTIIFKVLPKDSTQFIQ